MNERKAETDFVEMKVTGLTIDPFTSMPIIILKDMEEKCALPIWIGLIEASAIATELEHIELSRPMTHDLLKNIFDSVGISVKRVEVSDLADNTFYA
ncbi:MAG: bifunctional nuclease family protein, partial [Candidatus Portnoybacteria bacterium]|nr:bifunctional nuclease family protein [Candidatus Portnoybacteria bacterium]